MDVKINLNEYRLSRKSPCRCGKNRADAVEARLGDVQARADAAESKLVEYEKMYGKLEE